jgi:hypothetical protein
MEENSIYWIESNKIKFKASFNQPLDNFIELISHYDVLEFSNFDDCNNDEIILCKKYVRSLFNQSVSGLLPESIKELYFGHSFNQPLEGLPQSLTHLTFCYSFNQPLEGLPQSLTHLTFGYSFNQPLEGLPQSLTHLTFGCSFNQPLEGLPQNLTFLKFGKFFNKHVNLPKSIRRLKFGISFNQNIELPNIQFLSIKCNNKYLIDNLPNSLVELHLDRGFSQPLNDLPNQLKKISFSCNYNYDKDFNNLPESIEYIELPRKYNKKILKLPKNLKTVKCTKEYQFIRDFDGLEVVVK